MTECHALLSDGSDSSDRLDVSSFIRSDALARASDWSDASPTGPTRLASPRTRFLQSNQPGPICPICPKAVASVTHTGSKPASVGQTAQDANSRLMRAAGIVIRVQVSSENAMKSMAVPVLGQEVEDE